MDFKIEDYSEKYKLLIIDDELEITKAIARQFRKKYEVYTATSAKEGLSIMENKHIQVILSDQRMPDISGVDFFNMIKHKYPDALKLLLTGYADIEAVIGAINEGQIFRYITKPWIPEELDSVIKEAFEKYELITQNKRLLNHLQEYNLQLEEKVKERTINLENLNARLKEINIDKNKYIGMVAHDLRNPIGTAEAFSSLLLENYESISSEEQIEYIGLINQSCSFSLNLIHDFLDISKIEAGIFDLNISLQDYISFVWDIVNRNQIFARKKLQNIYIESEIQEFICAFDKNKIEQVLNNLITNAVKYSFQEKTIRVEISKTDNALITRIVDQGQGIPQNELAGIFKPFTTSSTKSTANEKSTGLGLAIVRKIVEAHNGEIFVTSEFGKGSVFTFTIPFAQNFVR